MTRVGTLALRVPRDRDALYQPTVFQRYARHEQARIALLAEYHLQGVSTRKVRQVVETLCGETVSASRVSSAMKRLDVTLAAWRARRLDAQAMPYLIVDAHYARIRREGQVLSTAALWVIGIRTDGYREYLGCWLGNAERTLSWSAVFRDLQARGLHGVQYVVSDEHAGRRAARQRHSPDAVHQRCQVHFLRNAFATVSTPRWQQELLTGLRNVWAAPTLGAARTRGTHTRHAHAARTRGTHTRHAHAARTRATHTRHAHAPRTRATHTRHAHAPRSSPHAARRSAPHRLAGDQRVVRRDSRGNARRVCAR